MKINLTDLSDEDLSTLIIEAMEEWASRQGAMPRTIVSRRPTVTHQVTIDEPPHEDKEFALYVKSMLVAGEYIKAGERQRVAEIAEQYPDWVRRQQLPTEKGTAAWRNAGRLLHRYAPAKER